MMKLITVVCVLIVLLRPSPPRLEAQDNVDAATQSLIDALEKVLPDHEREADRFEKEVEAFGASPDPHVVDSLDSIRLRILAVRSIRKIIGNDPGYLRYHIKPEQLPRWTEAMATFLESAKAAHDPFAGMTNGVRPFRSKIDGQLLLYQIALPRDYDPGKKYPLRIHLHAGGGFTWLAYWVSGKPDVDPRRASSDGAIHVTPAGRQHVGLGEVAILEAVADVAKNYSIDEDRLTIGGASWGGTGGFHFGTFLPDRFAAAHSLTGGGNYNLPVGNGRFDAYLLSDNLANLPFLIWDTPGDGHYRANHAFAEELVRHARQHPGFYPSLELTDPRGGHGIIEKKLRDEGQAWLDKQVRQRFPRLVVYKTYWLRYDGAYWAHIDTMEHPDSPARIEAEMTDDGCRVAVENVDRFHLDLDPALTGALKETTVRINDGDRLRVPTDKTAYFWKNGETWTSSNRRYPEGLVKKHGVSGPIQDTFMEHPVLLVHGEQTTAAMLDANIDRLISTGDGSGILRTGFDRKRDDDVTAADLVAKNLILVGTPRQNRFVAKIADKLPVKFSADGFEIAGREYHGADVQLLMVYPNPLNPERYILLLPEQYCGERPLKYLDYVVLQEPAPGANRARVLAEGLFDSHWR